MDARSRMVQFWRWFQGIEGAFYTALQKQQSEERNRYEEMINQKMEQLCGCKAVYEVADHYMEMTCESGARKNIQYLCGLWETCAPQELRSRWIFNAFRKPLGEMAQHAYFELKGKRYGGHDIKVYYTIDDAAKLLHLQLYCEGFCYVEKKAAKEMAMYLLELYIGELELEARIGDVSILDAPIDAQDVVLLPNLYEDICDIVIDRNWLEYRDPTQIYFAYQLDHPVQNESLRKDMVAIVTSHPLLFEELVNQTYDQLHEFSTFGAEYGYLYYEPLAEKEKESMIRAQYEKQIHELLSPLGIARTIGGAIGTKYAYIDMAIFDKKAFYQALEKINEKVDVMFTYRAFMGEEEGKE